MSLIKKLFILFLVFSAQIAAADPLNFFSPMLTTSACYELKTNWMPTGPTVLGYWKFSETAGGTTADSSGNGFTGTVSGGVTFGAVGKVNKGATFDGTSGYISMGNQGLLKPTFPFSVSGWVKLAGMPAASTALVGSNATGAMGVYSGYTVILRANGSIESQVGTNLTNCAGSGRKTFKTATGILTTGKWYFITVVYKALADQEIYVNGVKKAAPVDGSSTGGVMNYGALNEFRIGFYEKPNSGCVAPHGYLNGMVDDVALWSGTLTAGDIRNLYDLQSCGKN